MRDGGAYARWGKRGFDIAGALLLLALGLPLLLGTALAVRLMLGGPVLFRQWRAGRGGVPFRLVKFRSMAEGAGSDAARLGPFGRALRASALDELPQLFHVVTGRMSLVGPRPLLPEYGPRYTPRQATRLLVRPGLCGLAQSKGRNDLPWEERLEWDARYVERITFAGDLRILRDCALMLCRREGATMPGHATSARFDATS